LEVLARDVAGLNAAEERASGAKFLRPTQPPRSNDVSDFGLGLVENASLFGHDPFGHESLSIGVESCWTIAHNQHARRPMAWRVVFCEKMKNQVRMPAKSRFHQISSR
jgi:hypothetical protein